MLAPLFVAFAILAAPAAKPTNPKAATNTKDPVCKMKVDAKSETVVVRGQTYRICMKQCGVTLQKDPDKYLEKDGSVKAEKKG